MGQVHAICFLCMLGVSAVERQPADLVASCWHGPLAADYSGKIFFTCLGDDVLDHRVMDLTSLYLPVPAEFFTI